MIRQMLRFGIQDTSPEYPWVQIQLQPKIFLPNFFILFSILKYVCDCFLLCKLYGLVSILKVKMIFINKYENMQDIGKSPFITSSKILM